VDSAGRHAFDTLLPLLRQGDRLAQAEACEDLYSPVFRTLLHWSRLLNSEHGGPLADSEIQELTHELTAEAFMASFSRIDRHEPSRGSFLTFVTWRGRALMNGVVMKEIRAAVRRVSLDQANDSEEKEEARAELRSADDVEKEVFARLGIAEIEAILQGMPADQARAILEVWVRPRPQPGETPIAAAARQLGRNVVAMDSLLRRATRTFRRVWAERSREGE